ncbi:MAG: hypothetical protein Kow00122_03770 [Thermoleophilia bacterium]
MSVGGGGLSGKEAPSLSVPYRYIAAATLALAVFAGALPFQRAALLGLFVTPRALFLVHLVTLGWITMTIAGASLQLVPVALQVPVASERLAGSVFYLLLPGVAALLYGFWTAQSGWLIAGGVLLGLALTLYLLLMMATIMAGNAENLVATHVIVAFAYLSLNLIMGLLLVFNRRYGFLGTSHIPSIGAHGAAGLGGFFTILTYGVGYKLMGMFTLAEDLIDHRVAWAQLSLTSAGLLLVGGMAFTGGTRLLVTVALGLVLAGAVLFAGQITQLYRRRRRRLPDIIYPFVLTAVLLWIVALGIAVTAAARRDPADAWTWRVALWLGLFGWIGTMIMGHMYKINTFLAWLHKYADLVGRAEVPKLESLYEPALGRVGWAFYLAGVLLVAAAMVAGSSGVALIGSLALDLGVALYLVNMGLIFVR